MCHWRDYLAPNLAIILADTSYTLPTYVLSEITSID